jgi:hypothetical protein
LTTADITHCAVERGYLVPGGKTPEASMSTALYGELMSPRSRVRKVSRAGLVRAQRDSVRSALAPAPDERAE